MKKFVLLLCLCLLACDNEDTPQVECGEFEFDSFTNATLPFPRLLTNYQFVNESGNVLTFVLTTLNASEAEVRDCGAGIAGGCECLSEFSVAYQNPQEDELGFSYLYGTYRNETTGVRSFYTRIFHAGLQINLPLDVNPSTSTSRNQVLEMWERDSVEIGGQTLFNVLDFVNPNPNTVQIQRVVSRPNEGVLRIVVNGEVYRRR